MRIKTAANLEDAKTVFNRKVSLIASNRNMEYPNNVELTHHLSLLDDAMEWGNEMVRHGATIHDFYPHYWIGKMLGVKDQSKLEKVVAYVTRTML